MYDISRCLFFFALNEIGKCYSHLVWVVSNSPYLEVCMYFSISVLNLCKWWQNGTRCRDGVKVLWCHSHLAWLVF